MKGSAAGCGLSSARSGVDPDASWHRIDAGVRRVAAIAGACIVSMLAGCAYLNPYVPLYPDATSVPTAPSLPQVGEALTTIDNWTKAVESKHNEFSRANRGLNVATFGLAAGAVIAPVYNAYKDLITALALGAGTAYTANTLFTPADQTRLYAAAITALSCVRQKGEALSVALSPEGSAGALREQFDELVDSRLPQCRNDPAYLRLMNAFEASYVSMRRVEGADTSAAIKLRHAGQNVVIALNQEIDRRAPSAEAIYAAARSLAPLTTSSAAASPAAPVARAPAPSRAPRPCTADDAAFFGSQAGFYRKKQAALDNALDGLDKLDSACVLNAAPVAELALSQESVVLAPNTFVNVVVTGGRPPYAWTWDVEPPSTSIAVQRPAPDVFSLQGLGTIKDGVFRLTVRDSSASGRARAITVTARAS